jgi:hypothetical protein
MPLFLSKQKMSDLLVTAWEGGSTYWVELAEYIPPKGMSYKELRRAAWDAAPDENREDWKDEGRDGRWPLYLFLPYLPPSVKWKVKFTDNEVGEVAYLTPENMRQAIATLQKTHPHLVKGIKDDSYDAINADAWLQAAIFGEVTFG